MLCSRLITLISIIYEVICECIICVLCMWRQRAGCRIYQTQSAGAGNSQTGGNLIKSRESIPLLRYLFCIKIYRRQLALVAAAVVGGTAYIHHHRQNSARSFNRTNHWKGGFLLFTSSSALQMRERERGLNGKSAAPAVHATIKREGDRRWKPALKMFRHRNDQNRRTQEYEKWH